MRLPLEVSRPVCARGSASATLERTALRSNELQGLAMQSSSTAAPSTELPHPVSRTHVHTRTVVFRGYHREDGLWDIEGEMTDAKSYAHETSDRGRLEVGEHVHGMAIRLTVDDK